MGLGKMNDILSRKDGTEISGCGELNVHIRIARPEDAEALLEIYAPYVRNTAITFEYEVPSPEEFRERIVNTLKRFPYLVAERDGRILGYAYASPFHSRAAYSWCAETSIYVSREGTGQGIGRVLYEALEKALKAQHIINLNACIAAVGTEDEYLTNHSRDFHAHMGYRLIGTFHQCGYKFGRWYDMIWMEKMLGEHAQMPEQVLTWPEVCGLFLM